MSEIPTIVNKGGATKNKNEFIYNDLVEILKNNEDKVIVFRKGIFELHKKTRKEEPMKSLYQEEKYLDLEEGRIYYDDFVSFFINAFSKRRTLYDERREKFKEAYDEGEYNEILEQFSKSQIKELKKSLETKVSRIEPKIEEEKPIAPVVYELPAKFMEYIKVKYPMKKFSQVIPEDSMKGKIINKSEEKIVVKKKIKEEEESEVSDEEESEEASSEEESDDEEESDFSSSEDGSSEEEDED